MYGGVQIRPPRMRGGRYKSKGNAQKIGAGIAPFAA